MTVQQQVQPVAPERLPTAAVAGLVLALLFWPAGLLVSKQALRKVRSRGGRGGGVALAGVAISVLGGVATVSLLAASTVGAVRSGPVLTDGQSAACQLEVESANRALQAYTSAGEGPLRGSASTRLATLQSTGYLASVRDIAGLGLDESGRFTGTC